WPPCVRRVVPGRPGRPAGGGMGDACAAWGAGRPVVGALRADGARRRRHPGSGPGAGRDDGRDDGDRQPPRHRPLGAAARLHDGGGDRQRVQRSHHQPLPLRAVRGRVDSLRHHRRGERAGAPLDLARRAWHGGRKPRPVTRSSRRRHVTSALMTGLVAVLSFTAVLALVLILADLIAKGASSLDWSFFTKSPVAAGATGGGVANAIVGTGIIVGLAALIGLPVGIGTGLYLAEYGSGRLGWVVAFVADVLNGTSSSVVG